MSKRSAILIRVLIVIASVTLTAGCNNRISKQEEVRVGRRTAQSIERQYRTYRDPVVSRIGQELAAASSRPDLPWSFEVIDRPEVNAIALPGGPIYIYEGLLRQIGNDRDMLAAVLAHEVGHIEERHAVRQMERSQWYGLGTAILEQAASGDVGAFAQVASNLQLLSYGRRHEYDADDRAIELLRRTRYQPSGLVRLLELLDRQGGGGQTFHWLRTHPTSKARIDRAREKIQGRSGG